MSSHQPNPTPGRRARSSILAALVLIVALVGIVGCRSLVGSSVPSVSGIDEAPSVDRSLDRPRGHVVGSPALDLRQRVDVTDGAVPDGVTVFDDYPAVANLDPALLFALRRAAADAGREGVELYVNSGWRSTAYQEQLLADAVAEHGSRAEAARWVATPTTSPHVSGDAVDIGDDDATGWLSERGAGYGLCQIYANEPWHFELRPDAVDHGCPPSYADPTHDPRMQS
jgi:D-alanyl-D-alanine carboxypeptidase